MSKLWQYVAKPDLRGAVAVVTGASSGVGAVTAHALAEAGAHVVLAVRNPTKAQAVVADIAGEVAGASLAVEEVELADLASVRSLADRLRSEHSRLDLLVNNAAVAAIPRSTTVDGLETQIGVAHFAHFALTGRLLPVLLATPRARVVTLTSAAAARPRVDLDDLQSTRHYRRYAAYVQAKSANMLFALELDRRLREAGVELRSVAAQPGWTRSGLGPGDSAGPLERAVIAVTNRLLAHEPEVGAQPVLTAALADLPGGSYVTRRRLRQLKGAPVVMRPEDVEAVADQQGGLWAASERLTGVTYDLPTAWSSAGGRDEVVR